ncbi:hypothetical protein ACFV6F_11755, partial [Kitasatospora phosalacinea]|uniref:hypothetical protein n=1 Tax=Kitasatospora phosalacinea TaxID=2065 RepID=UPI003649AED7
MTDTADPQESDHREATTMSDTLPTAFHPTSAPPPPNTVRPGSPGPQGQDIAARDPAASPAQARRSVRDTLREAGPFTADTEANALLVVSELVTNANCHGGGATAVTARVETGRAETCAPAARGSPGPPRAGGGGPGPTPPPPPHRPPPPAPAPPG